MNVGTTLSAIAATVAAALAGINLYVSGRRENTRWIRKILVDAYTNYLGVSFETTDTCSKVLHIRMSGEHHEQELEDLRTRIGLAHDEQTATLTRLRLLSTRQVVEAAEEVHRTDHAVVELVFQGIPVSPDVVRDARLSAHDSRERMVRAARASMKLGGAVAHIRDASDPSAEAAVWH